MSQETPQPPSTEIELFNQERFDALYPDATEQGIDLAAGLYEDSLAHMSEVYPAPWKADRASKMIADIISTENKARENEVLKGESAFYKEQAEQTSEGAKFDSFTGLLNKVAFKKVAADMFGKAKIIGERISKGQETREGSEASQDFAIVFVDVDNFKQINDMYGHDFGDEALLKASKLLQSVVREDDVVSRFGGDEFTILAKGVDANGLKAMVGRLLTNVHENQLKYEGEPANVDFTFSVGAARYTEGDFESIDDLVKLADERVYEAKRQGRDTAVID